MGHFVRMLLCLLLAALLGAACSKKATPPAMPQVANPLPGPGAGALEMERYQLEEEKRTLSEKYADNIERIQAINARLIQINIELQRHINPHY